MNTTATPENILTQQISGMLAYWREKTEKLDNETVILLDAERQNLLRAVQMGLMYPGSFKETADILSDAFPFIEQRGYWREWIPLLEKSLEDDHAWTPAARVMLMARLGQAYRLDHDLDQAIAIHLKAEQLANSIGQSDLIARTLHDLLEDYYFAREYDKAISVGRTAINLLEKDSRGQSLLANCYKMLGSAFQDKGEAETAEKHMRTAVNLWRQLGDPLYLARALLDLARPLVTLKKYNQAQDSLLEAADLLEPTLYELDKCLVQTNLGVMYASQQDWEKAAFAFHTANSPYLRQSTNLRRKANVHNNLGYVLFQQKRYEIADEHLRQSAALFKEAQDELAAANALSTLADSLAAQNKFEAALPVYEQVIEVFRKYPQSARARRLLKQYEGLLEQLKARQKNSQPV